VPQGPFSLRESAQFGFGQRPGSAFDGFMRLAFCLDGYHQQVGVELRQDGLGVHGAVHGDGDLAAIERQVARVLSLDHDGREFVDIGARDPVIGRLQQAAPGLRPPLFYSPYEAAAWAVLSARRPAAQMAAVRARLSAEHGRGFELAGQSLAALPTPEQLLEVHEFPGLPPEKIARLHGVARAALDRRLDAEQLTALGPDDAAAAMRRIKGIGPFYAGLIVVRGTGFADVLPVDEPRLLALVQKLYGLRYTPDRAQFTAITESWRPLRTWCAILTRAASARLVSDRLAS